MAATIKIAILANAAKAKAEMDSVSKSASKMGGALKTTVAGGAIAAGAALAAMATTAIAGARESAQIHRVLESQIKGMGAASRAAFGSATKFAEDYGKAIGKDDDDILKVVNKLSTFPAAFGKGTLGAEGMRRATQAAFDLEAAGVGSAESNIIGLGKAMDNPLKGLTALTKSGVSFTAEQKRQITNYTTAGRLADAQKVLLAGIESNAKGAANAQADGLTRAKVALDGFAEGIASKALPYLDKFGAWFTDKGLPALEKFGAWFSTNIAPGIQAAFGAGKVAVEAFMKVISNPAFQVFAGSVIAVLAALKVYSIVMGVIRAATAAWAVVQAVLNAVMYANPVGLIVLAIIALVAAIVIAYKRSETFRAVVQAVWSAIKTAVSTVINFVTKTIPNIWRSARDTFARIPGAVSEANGKIVAFVKALPGRLLAIFVNANSILIDAGRRIIDGLWNGLKAKWQAVKDWFGSITSAIPNLKGPASKDARLLRKNGELVIGGFLKGLESQYGSVRSSLGGFTDSLTTNASVGGVIGASTVNIGTSGAPAPTIIELRSSGTRMDDFLLEMLRNAIRVKGGNVQVVLGR